VARPTVAVDRSAAVRRDLRAGFLGRVDYREAEELQRRLRDDLLADGEEHLLLLEHPAVFTLGRNADRTDIVAPADWLAARHVDVVECDRGGQVTFHGPGQLVGYPIIDLAPDRRDVRRYVSDLQEVLLRTLHDLGVAAEPGLPDRPPGVWVGERKIASIGVHIRRWVTTHGFALNLTTDLDHFAGIVACGLPGVAMTSVQRESGRAITAAEAAPACVDHFAAVFGRRALPLTLPSAKPPEELGAIESSR